MSAGTTITSRQLAARLGALRRAGGYSLQELAAASGVSRATLSRIENAEVSPTAATLGALATAFSMTISHILQPLEAPFEALVRSGEQGVWQDTATGFSRRMVSPPSPRLAVELVRCALPAGGRIAYGAPPVPGLEHHLLLLEGALEVSVDDATHALAAGDCLRYVLYAASAFEAGDRGAAYLLALHRGAA